MTRKYDQIIVVDIECTCWPKLPPPGQEIDIIEIGLCRLDAATGERLEKRSLLVRPERSTISPFCAELTGLTQEQVDGGLAFAAACALLRREYQTHRRVWASYGDYDRKQFEAQCRAQAVEYPFSSSHLNIKTLFTLVQALPHDLSLAQALAHLALPLEGAHHRGGDDAWNAARILSHVLLERRSANGAG